MQCKCHPYKYKILLAALLIGCCVAFFLGRASAQCVPGDLICMNQ